MYLRMAIALGCSLCGIRGYWTQIERIECSTGAAALVQILKAQILEIVQDLNALDAEHWTDGILRLREYGKSILPHEDWSSIITAHGAKRKLNYHYHVSNRIAVTAHALIKYWAGSAKMLAAAIRLHEPLCP